MRPFWLSGKQAFADTELKVVSPWDGRVVDTVCTPTDAQIEQAVTDLDIVQAEARATSAHVRATALDHVSGRLAEQADKIARLITAESGKPLIWSRAEVARAVSTFRWAAGEARRFSGELQRLDTGEGATGRMAVVRRFPRGPVLAITPFNFPLNLVAHKLAPAIAVGAPVLVKPAPATPLSALLLGELLAETSLPPAMVSVLPVANDRMPALVQDPRLSVVSFTGSGPVGWSLRTQVPRKHVTLELGGNAAVVVNDDWPDIRTAAERIALFGNYQAGQSCISVQRVLLHSAVYEELVDELVMAVTALRTGDPTKEGVQVGPVINEAAAERIMGWIDEAVRAGATLLTGGTREGNSVAPTVLTGVPREATLANEEVFGPVLTLEQFDTIDHAFASVNDSRYGLQTGVFTRDLQLAFRAHRELEVGGVVIGDVPSYRAEQMPYGGSKDSGIGREGVKATMLDLTEERVLVLTDLDL
jgi:aldehyde dehydrogenase (NAD+)